jgi:hypothetical protein
MSDWTPTDEQIVEVKDALKEAILYDQGGDRNRPVDPDAHLAAVARAMLVAVGPHIAASALREFADGWVADLSAELVGRTMLKTAMHDRADVYMSQIEKEAGR